MPATFFHGENVRKLTTRFREARFSGFEEVPQDSVFHIVGSAFLTNGPNGVGPVAGSFAQRRSKMATSVTENGLATSTMILDGDFDKIDFRGELVDGHLVAKGILADQAAMDSIPVGIYVLEKDATVVKCNKAAIAGWGRTPSLGTSEKFCGSHLLRYPSGEVMPHELAPPSVVINNGGTVRNADVICEQPNGNRLLALVNVFPIRDNDDEVIGAVNIFRHNTSKTVPGLLSEPESSPNSKTGKGEE
jgi:PAS domain-containing protein